MSLKTITVIGDSQSDDFNGLGVDGFRMWMPLMGNEFNARGANTRVRCFGVSGDTTTQMLARLDDLLFYDVPTLAFIYGGVNDPANSITQATTQLNIEAMCMALKHGAKGTGLGNGISVSGQANLPSTGETGQRYVVLSDTSSTGGVAAQTPSQATTVTGSATGPTVWEYRYALAGEAGWGRVAIASTTPTYVKQIAVISTNYLNYSTGGDTTSTPYASYVNVRAAQSAAVTSQNVNVAGIPSVVYVNLYGYQRQRIVDGKDTQGSFSWHVADSNQHHNAYGNELVKLSIFDSTYGIPTATLNAWLAILT